MVLDNSVRFSAQFCAVVGAGLGIALGDPWTAATLAGAIAIITAVWLVARPA
jgi:hypothetical protein